MMAKRASHTSVCRTTLLSLITTCSLLNMSLAVPSAWLFDSPFESSNCINTIPIIQTSTKLQCATLCGQSNNCDGFFHKKDTLSCLHIDPTSSSDCMVNNSVKWTSWTKSTGQSVVTNVSTSTAASTSKLTTTEQTTTLITTTGQTTTPTTTTEQTTTPTTTVVQITTPITTTAPSLCPITLPMNTYITTTLSDHSQFTFLFVQEQVFQTDALSRCPNIYNGTLVQIVTAPKMDFLMVCLNKTFELQGNTERFWIDAIKVDGLWKTSDGKDVLSDEKYWYDGLTSGTKPCVELSGVRNYKFNSRECERQRPFICENIN